MLIIKIVLNLKSHRYNLINKQANTYPQQRIIEWTKTGNCKQNCSKYQNRNGKMIVMNVSSHSPSQITCRRKRFFMWRSIAFTIMKNHCPSSHYKQSTEQRKHETWSWIHNTSMDLPRIELGSHPCHGYIVPLDHRPT